MASEAMASGVPVIASDNRGTRDYMQDGVNGYVAWNNTTEEIANAIQTLYQLPKKEYEMMQQNCLETAKRFSSVQVNKTMRQIYKELDNVN